MSQGGPEGGGSPPLRHGATGIIDRAITGLGIFAGLLTAFMMMVTVVDVGGRTLFNRPLFGAFELIELSMVAIVFAALPFVTWTRSHLAVTVVYGSFPPRIQSILTGIGEVIFAAVCALLAWRAWLYGERLFTVRETTLELAVPRGTIPAGVALVLGLTACLFLLLALRSFVRGERAPA